MDFFIQSKQVVLYEDELADNGVSLLTVKVVSYASDHLSLVWIQPSVNCNHHKLKYFIASCLYFL